MSDTTTAPDTDTTVSPRISAHATCDHPKTKAARAACRRARRSEWVTIVRGHDLAVKGAIVRVHTADDMLEGALLGWGAKRIVVRVEDSRVTLDTAAVTLVEGRPLEAPDAD